MLSTTGTSLLWLALFAATQDRRFFFPFTMHYAAALGQLWRRGLVAGPAVIVGVFAVIRLVQSVTLPVLAVELAVAAAAVFAAMLCRRFGSVAATSASSVVALTGLAL